MATLARQIFVLLVLIGVSFPLAAGAEDLSSADQESIRSIVSGQIAAFRADDGAAAYAYASPTIRGLFPSVEQFMGMVRNSYQPVYRPQSVTFGQLMDSPYGPMQKVFLVGPDGRNWVALYSLQRQEDGTWKINGCTLVEDDGASI
jgi:hypothetical protein